MSAPAFLDRFAEMVPDRPYAAHLDKVAHIRGREHALRHEYVQCNGPSLVRYLNIDVDHAIGLEGWRDAVAPIPNVGIVGPTGRPHYLYEVSVPVSKAVEGGRMPKALYWTANIERRLIRALDGDVGVGAVRGGGLMVKNPLHDVWSVRVWRQEPYDLAELDDALAPMRNPAPWKAANDDVDVSGLGCSCALFDRLRRWAYGEVEAARRAMSAHAWHQLVHQRAVALNDFATPLPPQEVKKTAKSVARWTWERYTGRRRQGRTRTPVADKAAMILAAEESIRASGQRPTVDMIAAVTGLKTGPRSAVYSRPSENSLSPVLTGDCQRVSICTSGLAPAGGRFGIHPQEGFHGPPRPHRRPGGALPLRQGGGRPGASPDRLQQDLRGCGSAERDAVGSCPAGGKRAPSRAAEMPTLAETALTAMETVGWVVGWSPDHAPSPRQSLPDT